MKPYASTAAKRPSPHRFWRVPPGSRSGAGPIRRSAAALRRHYWLYLLLLPSLLYFVLFHFAPYYGLSIAFKDFSPVRGIAASPWVGWKHFAAIFADPDFFRLLRNTLFISLYKLLFGFPVPIVFALLLNEVRLAAFKRTIQTVTYFPHFLSWVVYGGIVTAFLTPSGVINSLLKALELDAVNFLADHRYFRPIIIVTNILKEFGWSAIIYLAALAGVNPELYQSARVDGANRLQQLVHVTLPGIMPTVTLMFIISLSHILDAGFEQIYVMLNPAVYAVGDIIDTYVYRLGLERGQFSIATAVGLFKGVIGFVLIVTANTLLKKLGQRTIW
ncbi:ABC transporter permease [Paenibacillus cymbidii]|uniref:ABC transporter permease n=1 Tax=Paenibacillus cymbidii TaxID=1639034 RepID=UPI0010806656|nr:ABC transporter permease subunit [Paenibacillus cymbidii]